MARANQFHLGLKAIPAGLLSLKTKNLDPYTKAIRIKATTQPNTKKVLAVCGLAVPSEGDASVAISQLQQSRFLLVNVTALPLVWAINHP